MERWLHVGFCLIVWHPIYGYITQPYGQVGNQRDIWESHVEPHKSVSVENVKRKHMKSPVRSHEKCLRFSLVFNWPVMAFSSYR